MRQNNKKDNNKLSRYEERYQIYAHFILLLSIFIPCVSFMVISLIGNQGKGKHGMKKTSASLILIMI